MKNQGSCGSKSKKLYGNGLRYFVLLESEPDHN